MSAPEQGWAPWDRQRVPTVPAPVPWAGTWEGCGPARTSWEPQQVSPAELAPGDVAPAQEGSLRPGKTGGPPEPGAQEKGVSVG